MLLIRPAVLLSLLCLSCGAKPAARQTSAPEVPFADELPPPAGGGPWITSPACVETAASVLARLTTEQKAGQMTQVAMRYLTDKEDLARHAIGSMLAGGTDFPGTDLSAGAWAAWIDEIRAIAMGSKTGIPLLFGIDAVHGNAKSTGAVVFPHNIGLGCTGDPDLVRRAARVTALETRGSGVDWAFAPVLAAARDERWGRTYEAFGETPELAALYGTAAVQGLQGASLRSPFAVLASIKHFAGDGATLFGTSHMDNAFLDRGDVRLDMERFRSLAVDQYIPAIAAGAGTVMVSYSSYMGTKMHGERHLLTDVLKGELGFAGFVISDWEGIDDLPGGFSSDVETAVNAGVDMVMVPDRYLEFIDAVVSAVPDRISMERLDDAVRRILQVKCEMGMFDEGYSPKTDPALIAKVGCDGHRQVAREAVAKSLVVLKNDHGLLPLAEGARIHVAGSGADDLSIQCGGWTVTWAGEGRRTEGTTVLEALRKRTPVTYSLDGSGIPGRTDAGVVVVGEMPYAEWHGDRDDLHLDRGDRRAIDNMEKSGVPYVVILFSGRPMIVTEEIDMADGFVAAWLPGSEGDGIADVLLGDVAPTGKLSHSWPKDMDQIPINVGDDPYAPLFPLGYGLTW